MRLVDGYQASSRITAMRCLQCCGNSRGMVRIIIHQYDIHWLPIDLDGSLVTHLEAPPDTTKAFQRLDNCVRVNAQHTGSSECCQGILDVMRTRQPQADACIPPVGLRFPATLCTSPTHTETRLALELHVIRLKGHQAMYIRR